MAAINRDTDRTANRMNELHKAEILESARDEERATNIGRRSEHRAALPETREQQTLEGGVNTEQRYQRLESSKRWQEE